jgi:hypothetical protein
MERNDDNRIRDFRSKNGATTKRKIGSGSILGMALPLSVLLGVTFELRFCFKVVKKCQFMASGEQLWARIKRYIYCMRSFFEPRRSFFF